MGLYVETPDGLGEVLGQQSVHGRTSYLIKGAGFEGWYDSLQVTADFEDHPDDVIPNEENETVLPYPSAPQGPGWDGTNSTIQPNIDPHLDISGASDSLTGEPTDEDPVKADIEGLFEPPSRFASRRAHRVHFASHDDPILDVSTIPESSPTGLENSPLNPDGVDTDDLFNEEGPTPIEYQKSSAFIFDKLTLEDEFSFMRYAADTDGDGDDDDKKKHHENKAGYPTDSDDDGDDSDSDDGDSDEGDSSDGGDSGGDGGSSGGDGGGGHTASLNAAFALSTTADLHFLANFCNCASVLPLHSKTEHRELVIEASAEEVTPQEMDLDKLYERYQQNNFHWQESNLRNLVDDPSDDGDSADLYNKLAFVKHADGYDKYIGGSDGAYYLIASGGGKLPKGQHYGHYDTYEDAHSAVEAIIARNHSKTAAPAAQDAQPTQIESQIEQLMQFWAVDNNGWWHWTGSQGDLALLNQMQQQMMAVGMPQGAPGAMQTQGAVKTANPALLAPLLEDAVAGEAAGGAAAGEGGGMMSQLGGLIGGSTHGGSSSAAALGAAADAISGFNGGTDVGVAHHGVPFQAWSFVIEENTPPQWRDYLRVVASDKMVALAAWKDVVQKSKRLRSEGSIDLEVFKPDVITAYVQGDHGRYYTTVQRLGSVAPGVGRQLTSTQVSGWSCECEWGQWAWLRKRSFVGRMCSHAYALFSEMRSLDAKARRGEGNGKPIKTSGVGNKTSWTRNGDNFEWVSDDPTKPTAAIAKTASGYVASVWSDGTAEDSLDLGSFDHSEKARRAAARVITAHLKTADEGDVDVVGGTFKPYEAPDSIAGGGDYDPYSEDGGPESLVPEEREEGSAGVQEGTTRTGAAETGDDDEGPEETDDGIEEEEPDDEEALDEEIAEDEGEDEESEESDDGGHDEPHRRDDGDSEDDDEDEGTDNPGDESDDDHVEKQSSVAELQAQYGLTHLAGANYSLAQQAELVQEGEGKLARNHGNLNLKGTHYETAKQSATEAEDVLAFLF